MEEGRKGEMKKGRKKRKKENRVPDLVRLW